MKISPVNRKFWVYERTHLCTCVFLNRRMFVRSHHSLCQIRRSKPELSVSRELGPGKIALNASTNFANYAMRHESGHAYRPRSAPSVRKCPRPVPQHAQRQWSHSLMLPSTLRKVAFLMNRGVATEAVIGAFE